MTEMVLPGDANSLGTAFGGKVMQWTDVAAAVAARRHAGCVAVTASMDNLVFHRPIRLGDVVVLRSSVNRAWNSSMEVGVRIEAESEGAERPIHAASAYMTFVAVREDGVPRAVAAVAPETAADRRRFEAAELRRARRLEDRRAKGDK